MLNVKVTKLLLKVGLFKMNTFSAQVDQQTHMHHNCMLTVHVGSILLKEVMA